MLKILREKSQWLHAIHAKAKKATEIELWIPTAPSSKFFLQESITT